MATAKNSGKPASGGKRRTLAGLVPISLFVTPEERERVRVAAALVGGAMQAFARDSVLDRARKVLSDNGL